MNKLEQLVRDCQRDLGVYLVPDSGITDRQVISKLLSRLDGPQAREALADEAEVQERHMTFWTRYSRGIIWLAIVIAAFGAAAWLSSCAAPRYQPMGENIWRAL